LCFGVMTRGHCAEVLQWAELPFPHGSWGSHIVSFQNEVLFSGRKSPSFLYPQPYHLKFPE
jgi:hypothetical protein